MSYAIIASICEGHFDCVPLCSEECIFEVHPASGRAALIDPEKCTDCGARQSACPIEGAVLDAWQPEAQVKIPRARGSTRRFAAIKCRRLGPPISFIRTIR